jgi:Serine hydrolase (FSH1)
MRLFLVFIFVIPNTALAHHTMNTKTSFSPSTNIITTFASTRTRPPTDDDNDAAMKPQRILCLHGRCQTGSILSNKIAGARKKFQRVYELDFLDGPIVVADDFDQTTSAMPSNDPQQSIQPQPQLAWWERDFETGNHRNVKQAFTYVIEATKGIEYDAIIGFSQGGVLGASLVMTGALPSVKAVLTAGSPYVPEAFECAQSLAPDQAIVLSGLEIPKLHFAGSTDAMVPVDSTKLLCEAAGNGSVVAHEKGHLFPTKAAYVNQMMDFLEDALRVEANSP